MTLAQVNTAIEEILLTGQSGSVDGLQYSRANLAALESLRDKMMAQAGRATRPLFRAFRATAMGYGSTAGSDADVVRTVAP
jgi:hypothetical protein